jgi:lycopene beta-cyclase
LAEPRFRHLRVLIAEPRTAYVRDRTWCYWRLGPHPFEAAVAHRWMRWAVARPGVRVECSAPATPYECIPADRLYALALDRIAQAPNLELRQGVEASPAEDDEGVSLGLRGGERARLAFDSRPPPGLGQHGLAQLFLGQEIEVARPLFDPGCAVLMDFDPAREGVHFTYVLPMTETRALVEDTWFAPRGFAPPDHRAALRAWLQAHGAGEHRVLFEERGRLFMDPIFAPAQDGQRLIPLGGAAGAHRPATGYAFGAIQAQCDAIADSLAAGQRVPRPRTPAVRRAVRGMDRALLALLARRPEVAPRLFPALFAHCPAARLVRFLADRPRAGDLAAVAFAMARALTESA